MNNKDYEVEIPAEENRQLAMRGTVVLLDDEHPDSNGEIIKSEGLTVLPTAVAVKWDFKEPIGTATLRKEGGRVVADALINESDLIEECQKDGVPLYPAVQGIIHKSKTVEGGRVVERCVLTGVSIGASRNTDPRVPPVTITPVLLAEEEE